jgi:hypothetical protein
MNVLVIKIEWCLDVPVATVYETISGDISHISLLHRSFVQRYKIGVGSEIRLSESGDNIERVNTEGDTLFPSTNTTFDRWFLFRTQLEPFVSRAYARILFLSGIETLRTLHDRMGFLGHIRGIGPVTVNRVQNMFKGMSNSL